MALFRSRRGPESVGIGAAVCGLSSGGAAFVTEMHAPQLPEQLIASLAPISLLVDLGHQHSVDGSADALFREVTALLESEDHDGAAAALNPDGVHQHDPSQGLPPGTDAALSAQLFMLDGGRLVGTWEVSGGYRAERHALRALAALWTASAWAGVGNLVYYGLQFTADAYREGVDFANPKVLTDMPSMILENASEFDGSDRQGAWPRADEDEER